MSWWKRLFGGETSLPSVKMSALPSAPLRYGTHDGEKFAGGFGATELLSMDYWTLRTRSAQLFRTNLYARGIMRRLITNEINTGLHLEATPAEAILGQPEDGLADWAEDVESRFELWAGDAESCDYIGQRTFGAMQAAARLEALASGDVLVVLLQDPASQLPKVKLICGSAVQTPIDAVLRSTNRIAHGVETDASGRHVAYWIRKLGADGRYISERLPAIGPKTGRRMAWLLYGVDKRLDDVRGEPLLSIVLQSLREIDRYRDSAQRKAAINAILALFISKTEDKPGSRPLTGGAVRRGSEVVTDSVGARRTYNFAEYQPGLVLDELQQGETPHGFQSHGTDEKFGDFEETVIQAVAWANEIPPEILRLSFSSNYSASQAAINEFKLYLNRIRTDFGNQFCHPIYADWLLSAVLAGKIEAPSLLEAWRSDRDRDLFAAWIAGDWSGHIKPAVDLSKLVKGYELLIGAGLITRDRAARELTGTKYSKNVQKLARENAQLAAANAVIKKLEHPPARPAASPTPPEAPPGAARTTWEVEGGGLRAVE